jgi:hypothetical protein
MLAEGLGFSTAGCWSTRSRCEIRVSLFCRQQVSRWERKNDHLPRQARDTHKKTWPSMKYLLNGSKETCSVCVCVCFRTGDARGCDPVCIVRSNQRLPGQLGSSLVAGLAYKVKPAAVSCNRCSPMSNDSMMARRFDTRFGRIRRSINASAHPRSTPDARSIQSSAKVHLNTSYRGITVIINSNAGSTKLGTALPQYHLYDRHVGAALPARR